MSRGEGGRRVDNKEELLRALKVWWQSICIKTVTSPRVIAVSESHEGINMYGGRCCLLVVVKVWTAKGLNGS